MAGMWLYNSMFGGHTGMMGGSDAYAGDSGMGADADTGAGDSAVTSGGSAGATTTVAATPAAVATGVAAAATLVAVVATLVAAAISAAGLLTCPVARHEKPTRTRVGFSVSTAYHDLMPTDPNCPMCQSVAELEPAGCADLVWRFPHSVAVLGPWQFYTGYCLLVSRDHATELSQLGPNRAAFLEEMATLAAGHRGVLPPAQAQLRTARQPGAAPALAPLPALRGRPGPTSAGLVGTRTRRDRPGREDAARNRHVSRPPRSRGALRDWLKQHHAAGDAMNTALRIGTRGSPLALWQANHVAAKLRPVVAPRRVELVIIETHGDRDQATALAAMGGFGVFTKAIQTALLDDRVDVAVHSLKDLPTIPEPGLELVAVPPRGPTGDAFVSRQHRRFDDLPEGAIGRHEQPAPPGAGAQPPAGSEAHRPPRQRRYAAAQTRRAEPRRHHPRRGRARAARPRRPHHRDPRPIVDAPGGGAGRDRPGMPGR